MIFENFSPVALAPRLNDEDYSVWHGLLEGKNLRCSRKAWRKRHHLGQREYFQQSILYHSLYSWKLVKKDGTIK